MNLSFARLEEGYENALKDYYKKQVWIEIQGMIMMYSVWCCVTAVCEVNDLLLYSVPHCVVRSVVNKGYEPHKLALHALCYLKWYGVHVFCV